MNLIVFGEDNLLPSGGVRLRGEQAEHVARILKARPGDRLEVGRLGGRIGSAVVARVSRDMVELEAPELSAAPPEPLGVHLVLALPRPKFLGRLLQDVTAFGVKEVTLIHTARVEKSYWASRVLAEASVDRHLLLGLQQGRDTALPQVRQERGWPGFRVEVLPELTARGPLWVAEGSAGDSLPSALETPTSVLIGPEGGLIDSELQDLRRAGARTGHLGPRALRVESATAAVLSRCLG